MAEAHPTSTPKQAQTDTFAVFADAGAQLDRSNDVRLVARVEIPRYTQPSADGVKMDTGKSLALAVYRAVQQHHYIDAVEGMEFMVMTDVEEPMDFVSYEENTAFDGVWNPESGEQSAASTADERSESEDDR